MKGLFNFIIARCRIFFLAAIVVSCGKEQAKPPGILSKEDMVKVLAEVYVTEEKVTQIGLKYDSAARAFDYLRGNIAEKTGIPDSVFEKSLDYYSHRPSEIQAIYSVLVDTLQLREQRGDYNRGPR